MSLSLAPYSNQNMATWPRVFHTHSQVERVKFLPGGKSYVITYQNKSGQVCAEFHVAHKEMGVVVGERLYSLGQQLGKIKNTFMSRLPDIHIGPPVVNAEDTDCGVLERKGVCGVILACLSLSCTLWRFGPQFIRDVKTVYRYYRHEQEQELELRRTPKPKQN